MNVAEIPGLRVAAFDEAPAVMDVINEAFAPELKFREGPRIRLEAVQKHFRSGTFFVVERDEHLVGCVYIELRGASGYIGMLAVIPSHQGTGLGRKLMAFAEQELGSRGCKRAELLIVNVNLHLLKLYSRLGYVETGTATYPAEIVTRFPVHFIRMEKEL